jgi:hypothetical protein
MQLPLQSVGGNAFRSAAMSTIRVEFDLTAAGDVHRLVVDPVGIFDRVPLAE